MLYLIYPNKTNMKNIKKKLQTNDGSKYKFVVSDDLTEHQGIVIRYSNEDKESEW